VNFISSLRNEHGLRGALGHMHRALRHSHSGDQGTIGVLAGGGSDLRLWTVNGDLVGHVHCREVICSVAFSNQPEGISINVIAGGLENGIVR
jgi:hypothetical protein